MNREGPEKTKNHMQTRNYSTKIRGIQHLGYVMNQEANLEKEKKFYNYQNKCNDDDEDDEDDEMLWRYDNVLNGEDTYGRNRISADITVERK